MIIPASLTYRSNPLLDPERILETEKLALLTLQLLTPEDRCWIESRVLKQGVDGIHDRLLFWWDGAV